MTIHPIADLIPQMSEAEYQGLLADIRENGLREPILCTPDRVLLDGRHRLKACHELEIAPTFVEWEGATDDATIAALVFSLNLHRRHLTDGQKAMLGAELEERYGMQIPKGRPSETPQRFAELSGEAREHAAAAVGSNRQYVSDAKRIRQSAPDLVRPIRDGEITIPDGAGEDRMDRQRKPTRRSASVLQIHRHSHVARSMYPLLGGVWEVPGAAPIILRIVPRMAQKGLTSPIAKPIMSMR